MKVLRNVNNELTTTEPLAALDYFNQINAAKIRPGVERSTPKLGGASGRGGIARNSNIEKS